MSDTFNNQPSSGAGYPGQAGLNNFTSDYNKTVFLVMQALGNVRTILLVKVVAVTPGEDGAAGTVDVHPLVNQVDGVMNATPHGTVFGIPYIRLQGGKNAIIMDPVVDDIGLMAVCDRDISKVKATKAEANPGSRRRFSLADGIYLGGLLSTQPEQFVRFTEDAITLTDKTGNVIEMKPEGIVITPSGATPVKVVGNLVVTGNLLLGGEILGEPGSVYPGDLKIAGDVIAGEGTGGSVGLKTHTHTQPNDSHGDTEQPTAAPTAGS